MQNQKCSLDLYVDFLLASQKQYSGAELSRVSPGAMAHDSVSRWLRREKLTPKLLWQEARHMIKQDSGYLVLDDTVLDKPYAKKIPLAKKQYSGKHHGVVNGIDLVNLLWTDGEKYIPIDYKIYDTTRDGKTKNDHARDMLNLAKKRAFEPDYVLMDSWYTSIGNLKAVSNHGWKWIGALKCNRLVSLSQGTYIPVSDLDWTSKQFHKVWLKAYGFVLVSKIVIQHDNIAYIATNDLSLTDYETLKRHNAQRWAVETFHRGIKQTTGIERCYSRVERSQRNHILCAFLAFLKLEWERIQESISWYEQKWNITRPAVKAYLCSNA
jgi:putative transposase